MKVAVYNTHKFEKDHSNDILRDDVIARLMTFQNIVITSHKAFLIHEGLAKIAETTNYNLDQWRKGPFIKE